MACLPDCFLLAARARRPPVALPVAAARAFMPLHELIMMTDATGLSESREQIGGGTGGVVRS